MSRMAHESRSQRDHTHTHKHTKGHGQGQGNGQRKGKSNDTNKDGDHWEWFWSCCNCGFGAMLVTTNEVCANSCGHIRCTCCTTESHKIRVSPLLRVEQSSLQTQFSSLTVITTTGCGMRRHTHQFTVCTTGLVIGTLAREAVFSVGIWTDLMVYRFQF